MSGVPATPPGATDGTHVEVWRHYPFHGQEQIIQFDLATLEYEKFTGRSDREMTGRR